MLHHGACHCGRNQFEAEGEIDRVIECNCSHCSIKGYLLWFVPADKFKLTTPKEGLTVYTFNKHVIQHHFCSTCGAAPFGFGVSPKGGAPVAAINVRCVEGVDLDALNRVPFDGRSL
jgi:hypothetical protein